MLVVKSEVVHGENHTDEVTDSFSGKPCDYVAYVPQTLSLINVVKNSLLISLNVATINLSAEKKLIASPASHITRPWNHDNKITTQTYYRSLLPSIPFFPTLRLLYGNIWPFSNLQTNANKHFTPHQSSLTKEVPVCVIYWFAPDCVTPKIKFKDQPLAFTDVSIHVTSRVLSYEKGKTNISFSVLKKNDVIKTL